MRILVYVIGVLIYYFFIRGIIRKLFGFSTKSTREYYRNLNESITQDKAFSPVMYNQPLEGVAKEFIQGELDEHNFGKSDSIPEIEKKKSIITVLVTVVLLVIYVDSLTNESTHPKKL